MKAVIFDLDNTLVDFLKMKKICCGAAVDAMIGAGLKLSRGRALKLLYEIYDEHGMEYKKVFQKLLKKTSGRVDYKILATGVVAYRKTQLGQIEPYPNVVPTLIKLKMMNKKLAIVTDAPRFNAWLRLVEMKIGDFFDVVVAYEDTNKQKPHPAPFKKALKKLKMKPEEVLMIGDWPTRDIDGAKKLGMKTCFAAYGNVKIKKYPKADYHINDFSKIVEVIEDVKNRT